jgi:putative hydrolase of the HAD superfamily
VLFDIYGTLVDIETDERDWYAYLNLAKFLGYKGINLSADEVRWFYFEKIRQQIEGSRERYPEIDVRKIWREMLAEYERPELYRLNLDNLDGSVRLTDVVFLHRALTRKRLRLYDATLETLQSLKNHFNLGIVSDAQNDYATSELKILGIHKLFDAIIISGNYGFRKPDSRLFNECLWKIEASPQEAVFVGNDTYRDIRGAKSIGMRTILVGGKHDTNGNEQERPHLTIGSIQELPDKLQEIKLLSKR